MRAGAELVQVQNKKKVPICRCESGLFFKKTTKLFCEFRVGEFFIELVNTARRIYKFHFTCKKRMAVGRNLHFHQRIVFAIFPSDRILRRNAGTAKECVIRGNVFENDHAETGRMNIFFHIKNNE